MSVASVRTISKERAVIVPSAGYTLVVFVRANDASEALVLDKHGVECTRLRIEPGAKIVRNEDGSIECVWGSKA